MCPLSRCRRRRNHETKGRWCGLRDVEDQSSESRKPNRNANGGDCLLPEPSSLVSSCRGREEGGISIRTILLGVGEPLTRSARGFLDLRMIGHGTEPRLGPCGARTALVVQERELENIRERGRRGRNSAETADRSARTRGGARRDPDHGRGGRRAGAPSARPSQPSRGERS